MAKSSRPVVLAVLGGAIIVAGIAAFTVGSLSGETPAESAPGRTEPTPLAPSASPSAYSPAEKKSVYPQVAEVGLVPEPITTDPEKYMTAAVSAWGTYDTTGATTVAQWKRYLESWQNVYPTTVVLPSGEEIRFAAPEQNPISRHAPTDHRDVYVIGETVPGQSVSWKPTDFETIRDRQGRVKTEATVIGALTPAVRESASKLGELTSTVEFTQWITMDDGTDGEHEITTTKHGTAIVTVNCTNTFPAPDTAQKAGDCKLMDISVQDFQ